MGARSSRCWLVGFAVALFASGARAQIVPDVLYRYTAFWTCGLSKDVDFYQATRGLYHTSIDVHNPSGKDFTLNFTIVLASTDPNAPNNSAVHAFALSPAEAVIIDCERIQGSFSEVVWLPAGKKKPRFHSGFVILQSPYEIDVVAMNTLLGQRNNNVFGNGMEIHYIEPRVYNLAAPAPEPVGVLQLQLQRVREVLDDIRGALSRSEPQ